MFNEFNQCFPNCWEHCHNQPISMPHVHEFTGSTRLSNTNPIHNHRFAGISGPAIITNNSHVHLISTRTDSTNHFHEINVFSGPAIDIGNGRHIHRVSGNTSFVFGHLHSFINATLIERPS